MDAKLQFHEIEIEVNLLDVQDFIVLGQCRQHALQAGTAYRLRYDAAENTAGDEKDK